MARFSYTSLALGVASVSSGAGAADVPIYRCLGAGMAEEIRIEDGEWYRHRVGEPWRALGCRVSAQEGGGQARVETADCRFGEGIATARQTSAGTRPTGQSREMVLEQSLSLKPPRYTSTWSGGDRMAADCVVYKAGETPPDELWPISRKIAVGKPFLLALKAGVLSLKPGDWSYPNNEWVVLEGRYHSDSGTWDVMGVGFLPRGNPFHSCPASSRCGGIHESGAALDRWYRPEDHELVAFANKFTFTEAGEVLKDGLRVGRLLVPEL